MPRPWRLTRRAEAALVEIARWTVHTFGPRQADAYEADLIARCRQIAEGTAQAYDCRQLADCVSGEVLKFARAGQHFIIFVEQTDQIVVVEILHARSDLTKHLAALIEGGIGRDG